MEFDYKKYRWFFTKSGRLVYGGKSAIQNEEVVNSLLKEKDNYAVMHTALPGSPFAIIYDSVGRITKEDLNETAVWTACFSRAWREGLKKAKVDIFTKDQIYKDAKMKSGTFGVSNKLKSKTVGLKLVLIKQRGILRAVPAISVRGNSKILLEIFQGKISKEKFSSALAEKFGISRGEILSALPSGKFSSK